MIPASLDAIQTLALTQLSAATDPDNCLKCQAELLETGKLDALDLSLAVELTGGWFAGEPILLATGPPQAVVSRARTTAPIIVCSPKPLFTRILLARAESSTGSAVSPGLIRPGVCLHAVPLQEDGPKDAKRDSGLGHQWTSQFLILIPDGSSGPAGPMRIGTGLGLGVRQPVSLLGLSPHFWPMFSGPFTPSSRCARGISWLLSGFVVFD
jgi:hypothetical protein